MRGPARTRRPPHRCAVATRSTIPRRWPCWPWPRLAACPAPRSGPAAPPGRRGWTLAAVAWLFAPWRSAALWRRSGLLWSADRLLPTDSDGLPAGRESVAEPPHLGAEQLADLGQVGGNALLLPRQVVALALCRGPVPFDLALGVGQELFGLAFRLSDDLVGVLLGVGDELP